MRGGKTTLTSKSSSPSSSSLSSSILFGKRGVASQFQHPSTSSSFSSTSSPFFSFIRTFNTKQNKTFSPFPRSTSFFTRGNNEKSSLQLLKSPSKPFTFSNSFTQFRLFTTSESQKDFTLQDAKDALKQILAISQQKPYSDVLLQLKRADISIIIKWQFLVGQINEIIKLVGKEYDFSDSVQFQLKIFDMMAEDSTGGLQKEYVRNWDAWLFLVFDFMASEHPFKFDVARTRLLISDLLDAFQSPDYLLLVNQSTLPSSPSLLPPLFSYSFSLSIFYYLLIKIINLFIYLNEKLNIKSKDKTKN